MKKSINVTSVKDAKKKVSDIEVVGNGDTFQLLCKASSKKQGWMKSCKALEIPNVGCLVQVTTQQGDNVAEALTFVMGTKIVPDINNGRKLVDAFSPLTEVEVTTEPVATTEVSTDVATNPITV